MSITLNTIKCPQCGADLYIEEKREKIFCSYCGTQILITNDNEYIYRHIDEAKIKQAETDRIVKLKQIEMEEKRSFTKEKIRALKIKISIVLGIIMIVALAFGFVKYDSASDDIPPGGVLLGAVCGVILLYMWAFGEMNDSNSEKNLDIDDGDDGMVKVPEGIIDFQNKSYTAIEAQFKSAGFTNVKCMPLGDLRTGLLTKPNMVENITINGQFIQSFKKKYSPDASIIITYHSLK